MRQFSSIVVATLLLVTHSLAANELADGVKYESSILQTVRQIQNLDYDEAIRRSKQLIEQYPNSRLGHMLYGDLMLARAQPLREIGSGLPLSKTGKDLQQELRQRWANKNSPAQRGMLPENVLLLADSHPFVIVVDQLKSRTYVFRNQEGELILEYDYFTSIGLKGFGKQRQGDQKTPIGVYHVSRHIDGAELPDLYGEGAFPINYPNAWDRRMKRTGYGIWIHGTPSDTYNRSPWASDGCIVVSNPDFSDLEQYVSAESKTPVVITRTINWIDHASWQSRRQALLQTLSSWIRDWESLDHKAYLAHYSADEFLSYGRDFKDWDGHKKWVNRDKAAVKVAYENLDIFVYPGESDLVLMQYDQRFRSNNLNVDSSKEIFWRLNNNRWQIVYEGFREFPEDDTRITEGQSVGNNTN